MSDYSIDTRNKKLNPRFEKSTNLYKCETENPLGLSLIHRVDRNKFGNGKDGEKTHARRFYESRGTCGNVFLDSPLENEETFEDGRSINMGYHMENYHSNKSLRSKTKTYKWRTMDSRTESQTSNNSLIVSEKIKNVNGEIFLETTCKRLFKKRDHTQAAKGEIFAQRSFKKPQSYDNDEY